jgi:hypothetical protein
MWHYSMILIILIFICLLTVTNLVVTQFAGGFSLANLVSHFCGARYTQMKSAISQVVSESWKVKQRMN